MGDVGAVIPLSFHDEGRRTIKVSRRSERFVKTAFELDHGNFDHNERRRWLLSAPRLAPVALFLIPCRNNLLSKLCGFPWNVEAATSFTASYNIFLEGMFEAPVWLRQTALRHEVDLKDSANFCKRPSCELYLQKTFGNLTNLFTTNSTKSAKDYVISFALFMSVVVNFAISYPIAPPPQQVLTVKLAA
jgi:hypothetical protein